MFPSLIRTKAGLLSSKFYASIQFLWDSFSHLFRFLFPKLHQPYDAFMSFLSFLLFSFRSFWSLSNSHKSLQRVCRLLCQTESVCRILILSTSKQLLRLCIGLSLFLLKIVCLLSTFYRHIIIRKRVCSRSVVLIERSIAVNFDKSIGFESLVIHKLWMAKAAEKKETKMIKHAFVLFLFQQMSDNKAQQLLKQKRCHRFGVCV